MIRSLLCAALAPALLAAQQVPVSKLMPENGRIDSVLQMHSVRELKDGRVLIPNQNRGKVVVADFAKHKVDTLTGLPTGVLYDLPGDSTLIVQYHGPWVLLDGTRLLGMLPTTNPVVAAIPEVVGADNKGSVVGVQESRAAGDSDRVVMVVRTTGETTLLGRLWAPGFAAGVPAPVFQVSERPAYAADGWVAFVRARPYRVDWRTPSGDWIRGAPLDPVPTRMDQRERDAYLGRMYRPPVTPVKDWPAFIEPITNPSPVTSPEGNVLVKRVPTADHPGAWYDVINRRGELVRHVVIGDLAVDQIAGFGSASVYLWIGNPQHTAVGHLERHPWP